MKYIIDIEDEYTKDWVNETPMCKELCMPISVPNRQRTYHITTGFKLEPYTEPDRKAVEDEVWSLAREIAYCMSVQECIDAGMISDEDIYDSASGVLEKLTYQEAKSKYEAWSKQNIREGDEVIYNSRTRAVVLKPETKEKYGTILTSEFDTIVVTHDELEKTGRHFPEIAELLKKMRDAE